MIRKIFVFCYIIVFLNLQVLPGYGYQLIPEYLCQMGMKLYYQGKFNEALSEFKRALLAEPNYRTALDYIARIEYIERMREEKDKNPVGQSWETKKAVEAQTIVVVPAAGEVIPSREETMEDMLSLLGEKTAPKKVGSILSLRGAHSLRSVQAPATKQSKLGLLRPASPLARSPRNDSVGLGPVILKTIKLDESLKDVLQFVEIEQNKSVLIMGEGIKRFLVTSPNILKAQRNNPDEILVTGDNIGYTYLQVWDANNRWTLEFFTGFPKPDIETLDEKMRLSEEKATNFKLNYSLDWSLYEDGRSLVTLRRSSYSFVHSLGLTGVTPYGDFDSAVSVNRFNTKTDLGHLTIGLTHGKLGPFSEFNARGFDFFDIPPDFSNLIFPGISLRGAMFNAWAFHSKMEYTAFVGRENWAGFGNLSPEVTKVRKSFLDGINLKYVPDLNQDYQFTFVHGFGQDRKKNLHDYNYDLSGKLKLDKWKFGNETAYDSDAFANLFNLRYVIPSLSFGSEFRNINKKFNSATGASSRQGELGWLFNLYYKPLDNLHMQANLDLYRDRLYPAQDNTQRLNQDFNWNINYNLTPLTSLRLNYLFQNDLGKLSQSRYQNTNIGVSRAIKLIKDINLYSDYYHQENTNYSAHGSDYVNDRLYAGLRLHLLRPLYYYANKEMNWLKESSNGNFSRPNAFETGLDWSAQFGQAPWYGAMRFTYRDEEDTLSQLSFLSGQDYIEGYSQLSYRPTADMEIYSSCRMRNVWADNPRVNKHFEASINGGMRYLWDSGISWQAIGNIAGYVFKDYNGDGIMQRNEPPVEKIKVYLGKNKLLLTDIFGYYKFKGIRGSKAFVNLDTSTIPSGFVLTGPATQGVFIEQNSTARLDFGIVSRSEIYGFVFEDVNNNGVYDKDDLGVRAVVLSLEDNTMRVTDSSGRYSFSNIPSGEHLITLDLNSLPIYYLPKVAITKKIALSEGASYPHNIPLKRAKD